MDQTVLPWGDALLEREQELERIRAALRAAAQRAGVSLIVEGAPGIGKSRLLEEARRRASDLGLRVLSARGTELEQGFPFGVVRQLFERPLLEADEAVRQRWLEGAAALAADVVIAPASISAAPEPGLAAGDPAYAWQHGLYWLASNIAADSPVALVVDDLQWCDAPSARALAFIARRLEGLALAVILATRPLDPLAAPEAAMLAADPQGEVLRPAALTLPAVRAMVAERLPGEPSDRFVRACLSATDGNPFLVGELLSEAAARGLGSTAAAAADVRAIVPRGVANAVLLRIARLPRASATLARALSALGDGGLMSDAARLAALTGDEFEAAVAALVSAGVVSPDGTVRFTHPILRTAIYGDLSPAERERLHHSAARLLRERGAPAGQVAAHIMHTEPRGDTRTASLLRDATLLTRALAELPVEEDRHALVLELGQALARAGHPEAIAPLSEIVEREGEPAAIAAAAIELSGMLFFDGRAGEGAAVLARARERLPAQEPAREQLEVALLGASYTSASARRAAAGTIASLRDPGGPARRVLEATTLATLAMDEVMCSRSAATAIDLASRALPAGLPLEPHRGEAWAVVALAALALADRLDTARRGADEMLGAARKQGAALTVATLSALRAFIALRSGDLTTAEADAQAAIELAPDLLGAEFVVLAVSVAVLAGLDRGATAESLRLLIDGTGVRYDTEFSPSSQLRYASGVLRAAAGNHEGAIEELRACALDDPAFGGENPAVLAWRSAAALSLAELGHHAQARELAADELRRAEAFGAPRAIGIARRACALVGPAGERVEGLGSAVGALAASPARLEHARALTDLGASLRAAGRRTAAREPLLEALALSARCGAAELERRSRAELAAIGIRPRSTDHAGAASLTPSERRVAQLAAGGEPNRAIAQTLFVTEKTVETHLGRVFRKLDISSRRQLPDVLQTSAS